MTDDRCPDPSLVRALAEAEGLEGLLPAAAAEGVRAHVRACPRCEKLRVLASREDAALRGLATPVKPDARALADTLAALRGEGPRARPSRRVHAAPSAERRTPWGALAAAVAIGLLAFALTRVAPPGEAPDPADVVPPGPVAHPSSASAPAPTPPPVPDAAPLVPEPSPPPEVAPASPDPGPIAVAPPPMPLPAPDAPSPGPTPSHPTPPPAPPATETAVLARAGSAGLAVKGRALAVGEALPEGATVEVRASHAVVEREGSATLVLAARSSLVLERAADGGPTFVLGAGRALVTAAEGGSWAVGTGDLLCSAAAPGVRGPAFVIAVDGPSATVTTLDGSVRLESRRPQATDVSAVVAAGFAATANRGKLREPPQPVDAQRALDWVPRARRPASLPPARRVLRVLDAEADRRLVTDGVFKPVDASSARPFILGVASAYDQNVVRFADKSPSLARVSPEMLLEVTVRVSRRSRLSVMLFDDDANENFEWAPEVPADRWIALVSPLSAFANKAMAPRPIRKDDIVHALFVGAGPAADVELKVQGARFLSER